VKKTRFGRYYLRWKRESLKQWFALRVGMESKSHRKSDTSQNLQLGAAKLIYSIKTRSTVRMVTPDAQAKYANFLSSRQSIHFGRTDSGLNFEKLIVNSSIQQVRHLSLR
jgi:hypothetical protein